MTLPLPSTFYPELTNDRLTDIANELLDLRHETLSALSSEWDDAYTKESAVFGRCRNRLMGLCKERDWLSVSHAGMDVTLCIGKKYLSDFSETTRTIPESEDSSNRTGPMTSSL